MVRRQRRWVAGLVVLGLVFAQCITVAHACLLTSVAPQAATLAPVAGETMPPDCAAMAKHAATNVNACELHCAYGEQIGAHPDLPVASIAPHPALTVDPVPPVVHPSLETASLLARSTAPPVSVLFSRFLI